MTDNDLVASYDYELPPELIAEQPAAVRDAARLLTLDRASGAIGHRGISDLPTLLRSGDVLVLNETRVIPARLAGVRTATGGRWEGLFLEATPSGEWRLIGHTRGKLTPGETLTLHSASPASPQTLLLQLTESRDDGEWVGVPESDRGALDLLNEFGTVPLPPYIQRESPTDSDRERYQTVYARTPGAVAAPTAGLHFTEQLLARCREQGVCLAYVTLHVGLGTFRPVAVERLSEHRMHSEWCELPPEAVTAVRRAKEAGGRVIAVGTTTVRTLESVAASGELRPWCGETDLFIRPPHRFQVVDALLTNFHLPRSTLLVLVSAFAGREHVLRAYRAAIAERYRFYSYGDAMFIA
jgi:S-adenosylmethionine:tRNA ribosyltransferase-isomerase